MKKWSAHQEEITITNTCAPNIKGPKYIKQLLIDLNGVTHSNTIVENFNKSLPAMHRSSRQKINQKIVELLCIYISLPNGSKGHVQKISSNKCRIHILLIHRWKLLRINHIIGHKATFKDS
jgi:hypothetical protein